MASLLINKGSITADQIDAIWQKWFSQPLSVVVGATQTEQFAASLNSLIGPAEQLGVFSDNAFAGPEDLGQRL